MRTLARLLQLLSGLPALLGSFMLFSGLFFDDMFGDLTVFMGVPLTLAGAALLLLGIGVATVVRQITGASDPLEQHALRRPPPPDGGAS